MKTSALLLIVVALISCSDSKESEYALVGKWNLIATLIDPGDGSAGFEKATYDWSVEFMADGKIESSRGLCRDNSSTSGTYTDKEIKGLGCDALYTYELNGMYLILSHRFCIEPCRYKFKRAGAMPE